MPEPDAATGVKFLPDNALRVDARLRTDPPRAFRGTPDCQ